MRFGNEIAQAAPHELLGGAIEEPLGASAQVFDETRRPQHDDRILNIVEDRGESRRLFLAAAHGMPERRDVVVCDYREPALQPFRAHLEHGAVVTCRLMSLVQARFAVFTSELMQSATRIFDMKNRRHLAQLCKSQPRAHALSRSAP